MPLAHQRVDSAMRQSNPGVPNPPGGAKLNPFKLITRRNVSWDPNITIVEPKPRQRQYPLPSADAPSSTSFSDREPRRPILHPLLSPETTNAIFDARLAPATSITSNFAKSVAEPATASGARLLRLVSREFPWTIDVESPQQTVVTCADVFGALYAGLSVPITPSEWTLADDYRRESMQRANRTRRGGASAKRLRRIDWLGSRVYFKGLSRDDVLCKSRLLPEEDLWPDTWVVKFGPRS